MWTFSAVYRISASQARRAWEAESEVVLDHTNLVMTEMGCFTCMQAYDDDTAKSRCSGVPVVVVV